MSPDLTVLCVDDDENDTFFMMRAFSRLKRPEALRVVHDGQAAVEYLSGSDGYADRSQFPLPSLLLLDIKMPRMSGLDVLRWIRGRTDLSGMAVVMFTSSTQPSDVSYSHAYGANAFIAKPSNSESLSAIIEQLLQSVAKGVQPGERLDVPGNLL